MPRLACWSCGRQIYATSPLESLFVDERRCPRCGVPMNLERREVERRERDPPPEPARVIPVPRAEAGERRGWPSDASARVAAAH